MLYAKKNVSCWPKKKKKMYKGERKELRGPKKKKETKVLYDAQKRSTIETRLDERRTSGTF